MGIETIYKQLYFYQLDYLCTYLILINLKYLFSALYLAILVYFNFTLVRKHYNYPFFQPLHFKIKNKKLFI